MTPLWTILIATLGQRRDYLRALLDVLMPQVDAQCGAVNVLASWDNGELDLGAKRQALLDAATGAYVCSVDDDDMVTDDYVSSIVGALADRWPEYVGFISQTHLNGEPHALSHQSLRYFGWYRDPASGAYFRDITQANPMRTELARLGRFDAPRSRGREEDVVWAEQLRGKVTREVMIERVLYHHHWDPARSAWHHRESRITNHDPAGHPWQRLDVPSPHFTYLEHPCL